MGEFLIKINKKLYYEIFIAILSLIACTIILVQLTLELSDSVTYILDISDNIIWIIFIIDYAVRLIVSENKLKFIKNNKIDLISIIPFNTMFQSLRIFKFARVLKLAKLSKLVRFAVLIYKFKNRADKFLKTNSFQYDNNNSDSFYWSIWNFYYRRQNFC